MKSHLTRLVAKVALFCGAAPSTSTDVARAQPSEADAAFLAWARQKEMDRPRVFAHPDPELARMGYYLCVCRRYVDRMKADCTYEAYFAENPLFHMAKGLGIREALTSYADSLRASWDHRQAQSAMAEAYRITRNRAYGLPDHAVV